MFLSEWQESCGGKARGGSESDWFKRNFNKILLKFILIYFIGMWHLYLKIIFKPFICLSLLRVELGSWQFRTSLSWFTKRKQLFNRHCTAGSMDILRPGTSVFITGGKIVSVVGSNLGKGGSFKQTTTRPWAHSRSGGCQDLLCT